MEKEESRESGVVRVREVAETDQDRKGSSSQKYDSDCFNKLDSNCEEAALVTQSKSVM